MSLGDGVRESHQPGDCVTLRLNSRLHLEGTQNHDHLPENEVTTLFGTQPHDQNPLFALVHHLLLTNSSHSQCTDNLPYPLLEVDPRSTLSILAGLYEQPKRDVPRVLSTTKRVGETANREDCAY
jgi:hypothetical protein